MAWEETEQVLEWSKWGSFGNADPASFSRKWRDALRTSLSKTSSADGSERMGALVQGTTGVEDLWVQVG